MKRILVTAIAFCLALGLKAQNIFPYKLDNCITSVFCLDCGDQKANVKQIEFTALIDSLNKANDYSRVKGSIMLQVLVDSAGHGCVLSHTDVSNNAVTKNIVKSLNAFNGWIPAQTKGKPESRTSFNLLISISGGVLSGKVQRVDMDAFKQSFDKPASPEIYNKGYKYKNEHLKQYEITVWDSKNSNLPNNMDDNITIDKNGVIWLTIDEGLVKFDGKNFANAEQDIISKGNYFNYFAIATDNENTKWVYAGKNIYSYDDNKWTVYDPKTIGINSAYEIINNPATGEVFFCSDEGLTIYKNGKWSNLNKSKIKELPSNRVTFAKRDSKNRIWIGTFSSSVLIEADGKAISFNDTQSVLKGKCITSMDEDENGNVYLGLYEYDRKDPRGINNDEGIAIYSSNNEVKQLTTSNSGMPFNHVSDVLYDKVEKVVWIATDRAGLVRYDLKNGWENYHNDNSAMPTSYISKMTFDNNGVLYLATRQGLVRVARKSK